ncbi:MAG TPA: hypothetical protein VJZ00_16880 [Thermoanaerobaculia bacterium]|nr:hypothetical protein [Thermoanaerobaculia bacterium]
MLWDTRLQLHWAAQAAAGVGRTLLAPQGDFSHESFSWSGDDGALFVASTPRAGIRLRDMTLLAGDETFPMNGHTLADGFAFFERVFASAPLKHPPEGMPEHPVARGGVFDANPQDLAELDRYYSVAAEMLEEVRARETGAGRVRCWPHHFDIATLITISGHGEEAHTIGVGMAPGDEGNREPYYYVTPWPYPKDPPQPPLASGAWHTEGWFGAVLPARETDAIRSFLAEAIGHARVLV